LIAAALVLPPRGAPGTGGDVPPRLLGLSLLERTILQAARAGAAHVAVLAAPAEGGLAATLASSPALRRAGVRAEVVSPAAVNGSRAFPADGHVLVLERGVVFATALLAEHHLAALEPGEGLLFVDRRGGGDLPLQSRIKVQTAGVEGRFAALGEGLEGAAGAFAGVAVCSAGCARALAAAWGREQLLLTSGDLAGGGEVSVVDVGRAFALVVTSRAAAREARRLLLASVRKPTDGFVSRHCNRPVSLALSRLFIRLGLTPNMISAAGLALGLAGAWLVAGGGYGASLLGAFLFQLASVVDGSDGEVAKLTYSASPHGSWIDTACDQVASLAFFAALPVGAWRATGAPVYLHLGLATLLALAALFGLMIRHVRRFGSHGSMVQILDDFRRAAREPGALGRAARLVSGLSFTVRRDFFAMAFLALALVDGLRAAVWTIGAAVPAAVLFLAWFSSRFPAGR
jgi:phosphatidylglycerophosphate synthase